MGGGYPPYPPPLYPPLQSEDKIYIDTNYILEQRSDKCKKHENIKKRGIKNNKYIQEKDKKKTIKKNYLKTFARIESHCTLRHVDEHRHTSSSIGKHFHDKHSSTPDDLTTNFTILKKCNNKFDCLIYEMFFINKLRPSLNIQCDSIRAKVF